MTTLELPTITAIAPWFGGNRMLAHEVGKLLDGCKWVGVPFAGGMCELAYITARSIVVGDLHWQVINLAETIKSPKLGPKLYRELRRMPFHEITHSHHQSQIKNVDKMPEAVPCYEAARDYFVAVWMGRASVAGGRDEFTGRLPVRWNANGGDSCKRYRSAADSLVAWRKIMERCNFVVKDVFDFLDSCKDLPENGLYLDSPFPGPGDKYKHKFPENKIRQLAARLTEFKQCRIVVRYYDVPLIRELYPESAWTWHSFKGRTQANKEAAEVLITSRPAS